MASVTTRANVMASTTTRVISDYFLTQHSLLSRICSSQILTHAKYFVKPASSKTTARLLLPHQQQEASCVLPTSRPLFYAQSRFYCQEADNEVDTEDADTDQSEPIPNEKAYNPVDVETSIKYMGSDAYAETYGDRPVWYHYRPNHKFGKPKKITRKTCVIGGAYSLGNPCPICRDDHLVLDYRNVKLLTQFLSPNGVTVYIPYQTQICMKQNKRLLIALEKAKESGLIEDKALRLPVFDYTLYYKSLAKDKQLAPRDDSYKKSFAYKVLRNARSSSV